MHAVGLQKIFLRAVLIQNGTVLRLLLVAEQRPLGHRSVSLLHYNSPSIEVPSDHRVRTGRNFTED